MIGSQEPRIEHVPPGGDDVHGDAAVELVTAAGLVPDPWQERRLRQSLRRRDGRWAAFEVGICCPRQNGKNAILEMRELVGMFLLGERLIVHSAHHGKTARVAFRRFEQLVSGTPWLASEVKHIWRTNGFEAIELKSGQRIEFQTRTKSAGRGYSGDLIVIDEAMEFSEAAQMALGPILTTAKDPQIWYTGSAVDRLRDMDGTVFAGVRARGLAGESDSLCYAEWSLDFNDPAIVPPELFSDEASIAAVNPGYGIRFGMDWIDRERDMFTGNLRGLAIERFGVGDWPSIDADGGRKIDPRVWAALADPASTISGGLVIAYDVSPERSTAIGVAGLRADGLPHLEVIDHRAGTRWVAARLRELVDRWQTGPVMCDGKGPAGSLIDEIQQAGVQVEEVTASEHARGCGQLVDLVEAGALRHLGTAELATAIGAATPRSLGDGSWLWGRAGGGADIAPLVAVTVALWKLRSGVSSEPMMSFR